MRASSLFTHSRLCVLIIAGLIIGAASGALADSTLVDTFSRSTVPSFDLGVTEDSNHYVWTAVGDSAYGTSIEDTGQPGNPFLFFDSGWVGYGVCPEALTCADFDITWDFKISAGSEGGIFYRAVTPGRYVHGGTEYTALIHFGANGPAIMQGGNYLATRFSSGIDYSVWNTCRLKVVGTHHQMWIQNVLDTDTPLIDWTADPALPQGAGYISLGRSYSQGSTQSYDNVTIKNLDQYGAVAGTITDQVSSANISGVTVSIDKLPPKTATTGAGGTYNLTGVRYGSQVFQALNDNYYPYVATLTVPIGSTFTNNFQMKPLGAPQVTVFDNFGRTSASLGVTEDDLHVPWVDVNTAAPGRVESGVMVFDDSAGAGQGAALDLGFSPTNFDLTCTLATTRSFICYRSATQDGLDSNGYRVYLDARATPYVELWHSNVIPVHIELPGGLDWSNGVPVRIRVVGAYHQVWVNGVRYIAYVDGGATAKNGPGAIAIRKSGASTVAQKIAALKIDAWDVALPAEVSGQVKDAGGQPMQGAEVAFVAGYQFTRVTTGVDGKYKLGGVVPTPAITIQASKPGYDAVYRTIDLANGERETQDFTLSALPAGVIYDTFTRDDNTVVGTTEDASHVTWLQGDGPAGEYITNGKVFMPQPNYAGIGLDGISASDVEVQLDAYVTAVSAVGMGIMIRQKTGTPGKPDDWDSYADSFNYNGHYMSDMVNAGGIQYIGGVYSGPALPVFPWDRPHRFKVSVVGNKANATVDGLPWITNADTPSTAPGFISIFRRGGENWVDNIVIRILQPESIGSVKALPAGSAVIVQGSVVTGVFDGFFYIEDASRASGIKVVSTTAVSVGDKVTVGGIISVDADGEPFLAGTVTPAGTADLIVPLSMNGRACIADNGLPAVGLLVKIAGTVSNVDASGFTINDGSPGAGVKVIVPSSVTLPEGLNGKGVAVVGCAGKGPGSVPAVRIRTIADLVE